MEFKSDNIKLTPEDIADCSNLEQIMKWKYLIDGKITEVKNKLGFLEAKEIESPGYVDKVRELKLKSYGRVLGFLSHSLQGRAGQLKKDISAKNISKIERLNWHFVNIAKELLPSETFELMLQNAIKRALDDVSANATKQIPPETTQS